MKDNLKKFIKKHGVFDAAKYFGGMKKMREIARKETEVMDLIERETSGYLEFTDDEYGESVKINFSVLNFDLDETIDEHLFVVIDLRLKNQKHQEELAIWVDSYCEDGRPDYHFMNKKLNSIPFVMGSVYSVNGVKIPQGSRLEGKNEIISDEEAMKLMKENVVDYLKKLQKLL